MDEGETNQHIFEFEQAFDQGFETHSLTVFHEPTNNDIDLNTSSHSIWINLLVL
jgi:hypothetical protein